MTSTLRVRKKQCRARKAGLCIVCFRLKPAPDRVVCAGCNERAKQRVRRSRSLKSADSPPSEPRIFFGAETNSSSAIRQLLDAGMTLAMSGSIKEGSDALKAALQAARHMPDYELAADALERLSRQAWANADTPSCLAYARELLALPLADGSVWRVQGFLRLARASVALGRPHEALDTLRDATKSCEYTRLGALSTFLEVRAYAEQKAHLKSECLRDFQLAVDMASALHDDWALALMLNNFAAAAAELGEVALSHEAHSRAIQIAIEKDLQWLIPYTRITYVQDMLLFGDLVRAAELLDEASEVKSSHPSVLIKRLWVNAILNSMTGRRLSEEADWVTVLDLAFRSGEPSRIAPIVAAYHHALLRFGKKEKARQLLSKALRELPSSAPNPWLAVELVRYGTPAELTTAVPPQEHGFGQDEVAEALVSMLRSRIATFRGDNEAALTLSGRAEATFRRRGLKYLEAVAMELGGRFTEARRAYRCMGAFQDASRLARRSTSGLTSRQQQVAQLVLAGKTLREVAVQLGISKKTAEHHLMAVMQSLGINRRAELGTSPHLAHLLETTATPH